MTERTIIINLDIPLGNKIYWFLKAIMVKFPDALKEIEQ